jgi:peptidoglycan/LPS O-acetylase OafA/YrhL
MTAHDNSHAAEVSRYIPALDGIRALAILLVIPHNLDLLRPPVPRIDYPAVIVLHAGWIGVQLFFVLSGFLISGNLLDTRGSGNYFSAFFGRRALRIMPIYYSVLFLAFVITPLLGAVPTGMQATLHNEIWLWTFLSNWTAPYGGDVHGFGHFWSLAVEEQFYLVWPFIVFFCTPAVLLRVCVGVAFVALAARYVLVALHFPSEALYMFTVCRMDALALGAAAAALVRIPSALALLQRSVKVIAWVAVLTLLATAVGTRGLAMYDVSTQTVGYTILSTAFALILLLAALPSTGLVRSFMNVLACPPLRLIGRYSYGMYIFHMPLHTFLGVALLHRITGEHVTPTDTLIYIAIMIVATFGLAALSYELFERRFLRLKVHLMPKPAAAPTPSDYGVGPLR